MFYPRSFCFFFANIRWIIEILALIVSLSKYWTWLYILMWVDISSCCWLLSLFCFTLGFLAYPSSEKSAKPRRHCGDLMACQYIPCSLSILLYYGISMRRAHATSCLSLRCYVEVEKANQMTEVKTLPPSGGFKHNTKSFAICHKSLHANYHLKFSTLVCELIQYGKASVSHHPSAVQWQGTLLPKWLNKACELDTAEPRWLQPNYLEL